MKNNRINLSALLLLGNLVLSDGVHSQDMINSPEEQVFNEAETGEEQQLQEIMKGNTQQRNGAGQQLIELTDNPQQQELNNMVECD